MQRKDFTELGLSNYGDYCINDVELTYELFMQYLKGGFPIKELKVIDLTLRMFIQPKLELDLLRLESHLHDVSKRKEDLLIEAGVDKKDLMSNNKFAALLRELDIEPPTKISVKTGKEAYAFARTDEGFKALLEHDDDRVQTLANARLGNKSTLEESRAERFISIAKRGILPVPIKYYGAHTGRWSGQDKINLQNLPSRGPNGKKLKNTIRAPKGYVCVEADLAQIEARIVAWLAGQTDLVDAFARGEDVYKLMASKIYNVTVEEVTEAQRFIGKMTILGCGYGMGAERFKAQIKAMGNVDIPLDESRMIVQTYRSSNFNIKKMWAEANRTIEYLCRGDEVSFGKIGILDVDADRKALILPNLLPMYYNGLHVMSQGDYGPEYGVKTRKGVEKIYGGKVVENACQALAKLVIADQMILIGKKYHVALTVHDSMVALVPEEEADDGAYYVYTCLRHVPAWAKGLPLDCDVGYHKYYGSCGDNTKAITKQCAKRWASERTN
jgi:DNA polymerase